MTAGPESLPLSRRSVSWRVNAEPFVFLGGGRALLLQVAHPKVAAGVEQHSTYVSDPWGRLFRTVDVMAKLTFGAPAVSRARADMLTKMHRRVVGTTDDGEPYGALDGDLLLWVWATLCDTALVVYERVRPPLSAGARLRYYDEWKLVAAACGVPDGACPPTWDEFQAYIAGTVRDDLYVSTAARSVAHATMAPPLPWPLGPAAARTQRLVTVGLLPPATRDAYGFRWSHARERRLQQFFYAAGTAGGVVPRRVREMGMRYVVERPEPLDLRRLRIIGARLTARRMAEFDTRAS
jgi:uncharacterized protein (DUF2236 family)